MNFKTFGFLVAIAGAAFSITLCGIGIGIYMVGVLLQFFVGKDYDWRPYPQAVFLIPLIATLLVSLFISDYFFISLRGFGKYLQGFILLYAGHHRRPPLTGLPPRATTQPHHTGEQGQGDQDP